MADLRRQVIVYSYAEVLHQSQHQTLHQWFEAMKEVLMRMEYFADK